MNCAKDFIGRDLCYDCLECSLSNHEIVSAGGLIFENDYIVVHPHLLVKLKGFIVVSPKRHVCRRADLTKEEVYSIEEAITRIILTLKVNQIAEEVNVQYIERDNEHLQVWVVAALHPLLKDEIDFKWIASDLAMKYRGIEPSEPIEILYTVQILKTYFKAKGFSLIPEKA